MGEKAQVEIVNWKLLRDMLCFDPAYAHDIVEDVLRSEFNIEIADKDLENWAEAPIASCECAISERGFMYCFKISLSDFVPNLDSIWDKFLQVLDENLEEEIE